MKFKTRAAMESFPDFKVNARMDPVNVRGTLSGQCETNIDSITFEIKDIPVRVAIPFLKNRRIPPLMGSIGGGRVTVSPISIKMGEFTLKGDGVFGTKGLTGQLDGSIDCKTEMHADGTLCGNVGSFTISLGDDDECRDEEQSE